MFKNIIILLVLSNLVNGQGNRGTAKITAHNLIELNEDNWETMLTGEWMVEFFAPWCPACKNLASTWEKYADIAIDMNVNVAQIDVTTSPSLSGRFFVTALPTIYHVINGEFRQYRGSRDADSLVFFIKQKQWQKLEPVSAWKKPDTIHMSILSYFFKLSHALKDLNTRLQEEYGLPTWGSYALFAFATIFVGATLGLVLVCIVDSLYPPKKLQRQSFDQANKRDTQQGVEDLVNDELEDENEANKDSDVAEDDDEDEEDDAEVEEEEEKKAENAAKPDNKENHLEEAVKTVEENTDEALKKLANTFAHEDASSGEVRKRKARKD